jgi:hypothetical protein
MKRLAQTYSNRLGNSSVRPPRQLFLRAIDDTPNSNVDVMVEEDAHTAHTVERAAEVQWDIRRSYSATLYPCILIADSAARTVHCEQSIVLVIGNIIISFQVHQIRSFHLTTGAHFSASLRLVTLIAVSYI